MKNLLIYLGLMFCEESLNKSIADSKTNVQMATHTFQMNLVRGLVEQREIETKIISIPPVGSYPVNSSFLYISSSIYENGKQLGYVNLPWLKHIEQYFRVIYELRSIVESNRDSNISILTYSLYEPYIYALDKIKKEYPKIRICLLQTDAVTGRDGMKKYMTSRNIKKGNKLISVVKKFDSFVVLSEHLRFPLEIGDRKFIVMECICDENQEQSHTNSNCSNVFLYTGTLDKQYGIVDLVNAITTIPEATLFICGKGDAEEEIKAISSKNENIKLQGFLCKKELEELRNKCDFLINPRRPSGDYTKYSFPSKTAEYLMSGKPVLMYKLEAIPEEYDRYINYLHGDTPETIAIELKEFMSRDYSVLVNKAKKARLFMIENKKSCVQAKRIVELLFS